MDVAMKTVTEKMKPMFLPGVEGNPQPGPYADMMRMMQANGGVPATVGRNNMGIRDVDGKLITQAMVAVKDAAWIEYKWKNPVSNEVENKATYTIRAGDDLVIGVGAFYK